MSKEIPPFVGGFIFTAETRPDSQRKPYVVNIPGSKDFHVVRAFSEWEAARDAMTKIHMYANADRINVWQVPESGSAVYRLDVTKMEAE